jgi:hypothetical protein
MREEWRAHLDVLPGGLSKLSAAAGFLLSTFWGFRRNQEDEPPIEVQERIALEVALALNQERDRVRSAMQEQIRKEQEKLGLATQRVLEIEKLLRPNRTQLVKRRTNSRSSAFALSYGYKTTRHKGEPYRYETTRHRGRME